MRFEAHSGTSLVAMLACMLLACGDDGRRSGASDDGKVANAAECSTGPLYDAATRFAQGTWEDAGVVCTPHCGQDQKMGWQGGGMQLYSIESLPSGSCTQGTPACEMQVGEASCGKPAAIWLSFVCKCVSDSWTCAGSYQGGGICPVTDAAVP